jgi:penicillin-binding protein 1A
MVAAGWLPEAEAEYWRVIPTVPQYHEVLPKANDYFPSEVEKQLLDVDNPAFAALGQTEADRRKAVYQGGLKVYTTFDPAAQAQAIAARDSVLPLENGVFPQAGVDPETGQPNVGSAAVISIEPATGAVRTMVGGPGFDNYKFNLAWQNPRQVGSSFKTFVLTTIMDQGYSPDDIINGLGPCQFSDRTEPNGVYDAGNYADGSGSVDTITSATTHSSNCAFVRLGLIAGGQNVADMAHRLGIDANTDLCAGCKSLPLGVASITPREMASAYATLANDGVYNAPYLIERIEDRNGQVIYAHTPAPEQRVSPQVARLVTSVLEANVQGGTGTAARVSGQQVAGKTGTTQDSTDGWFVGYTPSLATAVWVGGLGHNFTIHLGGRDITGGSYPARIWGAFMNAWQQSHPNSSFAGPTPVPARGTMLEVPGGIDLSPPPAPPPPEPAPVPVPVPTPPFPFPFPGNGNGNGNGGQG